MLATQQARDAKSKALKKRYTLIDCYLFDIGPELVVQDENPKSSISETETN